MAMMDVTPEASQAVQYNVHSSLHDFGVPYKTYLSNIPEDPTKVTYHWIIVGAVVFDSQDRILLIQRSAKEFLPNLWEIPGGGCEVEDKSIIHTVVRELQEETGLQAKSVGSRIGDGYHFPVGGGNIACKYNFMVEVADQMGEDGKVKIKLDPNEHQDHVWATEEQVKAGKVGGIELKFTSLEQEKVVLEAFESRRKQESQVDIADEPPMSSLQPK
ncbi:hypothetical protein PMZ80_009758 [Knufia obscura]|uniref:Nudix hydrolase domain-containing protein n=2 Tax=Knufia TaxID=430999 RepID=A0AAN8EFQ5_9EURO|nr:hypothetical protein PMZ80_009758 [Knufia obscura]KAK5949677.1 hypothetical protein OHC33_009274 [Knufia fluminis]